MGASLASGAHVSPRPRLSRAASLLLGSLLGALLLPAALHALPVAIGGSASTDEDVHLRGQLEAAGVGTVPGTVTYRLASPVAQHGVVGVDTTTGGFVYTPDKDYYGDDSFGFVVTEFLSESLPALMRVAVRPVNDAPEGSGASGKTAEDTSWRSTVAASDVESDPMSYHLKTDARYGRVEVESSTGSFTYTPAADFFGADWFTVVARDQWQAESAAMRINVEVTPVDDPPRALDLSFAATPGKGVSGQLHGFDPDGGEVTYSVPSPPSRGSLTVQPDGKFSYTAPQDAAQQEVVEFGYEVTEVLPKGSVPASPSSPLSTKAKVSIRLLSDADGYIGDTLLPKVYAIGNERVTIPPTLGAPSAPVVDMAVDRANRRLYVLTGAGLEVYTIDRSSSPAQLSKYGSVSLTGFCLALSADGRTAYVGRTGEVVALNLYPGTLVKSGTTVKVPEFSLEHLQHFVVKPVDRRISVLAVHPAGDRLVAFADMRDQDKKIDITNDLLRSDVGYGTRIERLADADLPADFGFLAQLDISGDIAGATDTGRAFTDPVSIRKLTYDDPPKTPVPNVPTAGVAIGIRSLTFSPDGNCLYLTAVGAQTVRATAFGIMPTTDEGTGGILVLDVRPAPKPTDPWVQFLKFIPTTEQGEDTSALRMEIRKQGWKVVHPLVQMARMKLMQASGELDFDLATNNSFTVMSSLNAFTTYSIVLGELEDSFKDYGYMQAYFNLYPRDMVGASGLAVDHTGDFGVVTLQNTNNLGLLTLRRSAEPAGFTPENPPDAFIARGTGKTINGFGDPHTGSGMGWDLMHSWAYPLQPVFSADDTELYIAMAGGTPKPSNTNGFGAGQADQLRLHKDLPDSPYAGGNPPPGYVVVRPVELRSPRKAAAHHLFDSDGDGFSDQLEAYNRFNSLRTIFGDDDKLAHRNALVSTTAEQLSDPSAPLPASTKPTDVLDQSLLLPPSGLGYRLHRYGLSESASNAGSRTAISAIERLGQAWAEAYALGAVTRPYFVVGLISKPGGGIITNAAGEAVQYGARNGFQVNFPYMGLEADPATPSGQPPELLFTDRAHDFVLSNVTSSPRDNSIENLAGFDASHMEFFLQLLLADGSVSKIELDPAVRDVLVDRKTTINFADPRFEFHGSRDTEPAPSDSSLPARPENRTRRDLDCQMCVSFSPLQVAVVVADPPPPDVSLPDPIVQTDSRFYYTLTLPDEDTGLDRDTMRIVLSLPPGATADSYIVRDANGRILELGKEYTIQELFGDKEKLGLWVDVLVSGDQQFAVEMLYPGMDNLYSLHDSFEYIQWTEDAKVQKHGVARHIANCTVGRSEPSDNTRTYLRAETYGFDAPVTYHVVRWEPAPTDVPTEDSSEPTLDATSGLVQSGKDSGTLYVDAYATTPSGRQIKTGTLAIEVGGCGGCVTCTQAGSSEFSSESLDFHIGDGNEGKLRYRVPNPGDPILDPGYLDYPYHSPGTRIVRTRSGALRQILTENAFFDILAHEDDAGFTINTYRAAKPAFDPQTGLFDVSGLSTPASTLAVAPDPDRASDSLRITRNDTGTPQIFAYAQVSGGWTLLEQLDPSTNTPERQQQRITYPGMFFGQTAELTERTMMDGEGNVVSKEITVTAEVRPGVSRLVGRISDPDGANRITRYTYNSQDLVESVSYPNGRWLRYEYDAQKRVTKQVEPWLNAESDAPEAQCRVTTFDYTPLSADDTGTLPEAPRTTVVFALGTEISRSYDLYVGQRHDSITALKPGAAWDDPANLVSSSTTIASGYFAGRTESVKNPDGTMSLYAYSLTGTGGETTIVKSGVPNAEGTDIVDGTESTTKTNHRDQTTESTTVDIASGITLSSQIALDFDPSGRPTHWLYLDGTESKTVYGCCGVDSETDRNGIVTTYEYDNFKRTKAVHRLGLTTRYEYDTRGRTLKTIQVGTDGSEIVAGHTDYLDVIGDSVDSFDPLDRKTSSRVAYHADGTTTRTTTIPGDYTQWQKSARDGRPLETGGTAAAPTRYEYRIERLGDIPCSVTRSIARVWDAATSSYNDSQWTESWSDMAGRTVRVAMADGAKAENFYNTIGQIVRSVDPDHVTTLYAYNERGEQYVTAIDLDRDGEIDFDGSDRITRSTSVVTTRTWDGETYDVVQSTSEVWAAENADTPLTVSVQAQSIDGRHSWTESFGATAHQETVYPETRDGSWIVTATAPDKTSTVSTYTEGRLLSVSQISNLKSEISRVTYGYDEFGRPNSVTDPRTGTTTTTFFADGQVDTVKAPHPELAGQFLTTKNVYDARGLLEHRELPDGSAVYYTYTAQGQLDQVHGSQTYPLDYDYDSQGRMLAMTTWQDFAGDSGKATTTWQYDPARGYLASKTYSQKSLNPSIPADAPVRYGYTAAGRLKNRTWSRGIVTVYDYGQDGALSTVDYSDATPDIAYAYHRLGQVKEVRDGVLANGAIADADLRYRHEYSLTAELRPDTETIHTLGTFTLQRQYEADGTNEVPGRYKGYTLSSGSEPSSVSVSSVTYSYDSAGRLGTVTSPTGSFIYAYLPNAGLIETVTGPVHTVHNTYQPFGYGLKSKTNQVGTTVVSKFEYRLNDLGQRTAMITTGTAFAQSMQYQYRYNEKGEVIAGDRFQGTDLLNPGPAIPTDTFSYAFDDIGNRLTATRASDPETGNPKLETYDTNLLNQYTRIDTSVASSASVPSVSQSVSPVHDADGNLVSDSRWIYTWNGENRLIEMEEVGASLEAIPSPASPRQKLTFTYDYQGRRITKRVFTYNDATDLWEPAKSIAFVYDGWNLLAEFKVQGSLINVERSFVWGLDLSNSLQGAGGVGGLLAAYEVAGSQISNPQISNAAYATFDANGNVSEYIDASGATAAHFDYSPFGQTIRSQISKPEVADSSFRFSTKYTDSESALLYYGLRYFSTGRAQWLSRDHIGESGEPNLYSAIHNDAVSKYDYLGLDDGIGAYKDLDTISGTNRHHLNPQGVYGDVIPYRTGVAARLEGGNAITQTLSSHYLVHESFNKFIDTYSESGRMPTNQEVTYALYRGYLDAGLSKGEAMSLSRSAIKERVQYNLLGGELAPALGKRLNQRPIPDYQRTQPNIASGAAGVAVLAIEAANLIGVITNHIIIERALDDCKKQKLQFGAGEGCCELTLFAYFEFAAGKAWFTGEIMPPRGGAHVDSAIGAWRPCDCKKIQLDTEYLYDHKDGHVSRLPSLRFPM